jgi:hypothetical protein
VGLELYTVEWKPNPLLSVVNLTDAGRLRLQLGVAAEVMSDVKAVLSLAERENEYPKWISTLDSGFFATPESEDDRDDALRWLELESARYEQWLSESHGGDCTCVPATCIKCYVEMLLGISTITGLGKHEASGIGYQDFPSVTAVIEHLQRPIAPTWGTPDEWAPYMTRWKQERNNAIAWMTAYGKEHNL